MKSEVRRFLLVHQVLIVLGTILLVQPQFSAPSERDAQYFLARRIAESAFDAASAACGCGLLAGPMKERYTPAGCWMLWAIGVVGAVANLAFLSRSTLRIAEVHGRPSHVAAPPELPAIADKPPISTALILSFAAFFFLGLVGVVFLFGKLACPTVTLAETAWLTGCAFFSIGLLPNAIDAGTAWTVAAVALIGSLGWPFWLLLHPRGRRHGNCRLLRRSAWGYAVAVLGLSMVLCAIESPRGGESVGKLTELAEHTQTPLSQQPLGSRFARCSVAAITASSGLGTEALSDRSVRDSSRVLLAYTMLLGGAVGGFSGGMCVSILWLGGRRHATAWKAVATRLFIGFLLASIATAFGLILISTAVATRYQPAPTFSDAYLDACSALCGGNLTSGLTASVTGRNLVSGIGLGISFDYVGMGWLVLAMLFGRIWPLAVLSAVADRSGGAG